MYDEREVSGRCYRYINEVRIKFRMHLISLLCKIRLSNNLFFTEIVELLGGIVPYRDYKSSSGAMFFYPIKARKKSCPVKVMPV